MSNFGSLKIKKPANIYQQAKLLKSITHKISFDNIVFFWETQTLEFVNTIFLFVNEVF